MRIVPLAFSVFALLPSLAQAATWNIDASHTRVGFRVGHMMVSSVEGHFTGVGGAIEYDVGKLDALSINVEIDMSTVDTGNTDRDDHLRGKDFLDVASYPTMRFVSTGVKPQRKGGFDISGNLTLHGVTKPVVLHASGLTQAMTDPWGNTRLGASATTTINRQDFGVSWNQSLDAGGVLVGDEIELKIDVEFVRPK